MTRKLDVRENERISIKKNLFFRNSLGYPVTCLKFYANKEDLKADHHKMLAATCRKNLEKRFHSIEFSVLSRHSWLCQSLALSNPAMCFYLR